MFNICKVGALAGGGVAVAGGAVGGGEGGGEGEELILNATFATDDDGFTSGTRVAEDGWVFETGYLSWPANSSQTVDLDEAQTEGIHRLDFSVFVPDNTTGANLGSFVYALPTAGAISSANSLGSIVLSRTGAGVTAGMVSLQYRTGGGFVQLFNVSRQGWVRISLVLDLDAGTYDLYVADLIMQRGIPFENGAAADFARVGIASASSTPTTHFDDIKVTKNWTPPTESVLVTDDFTVRTGEVEDTQPDTDGVSVNKQNWHVPRADASGKGAFTRGVNGLVPDSGVSCSALYRTGGEGVWEATFTASAADEVYGGILLRSWGGEDESGSHITFRYWSGSGDPIALFADQDDHGSALAGGALSGTSITAGNDFTLRIEARGRYFRCWVNDVEQFGGWVQQTNARQRGQMQENHAGPVILTTGSIGTDNFCKDFTYTGRLLDSRQQKTIGDWTMLTEGGRAVELYNSEVDSPTTNLFWSGGIQFGHMAEHDMMPYIPEVDVVYDTSNVMVLHQRAPGLSEGRGAIHSDVYMVFRRDAVWVADRIYVGEAFGGFAPDIDLRESEWSLTFRHAPNTGASAEVTKTLADNFVQRGSTAVPPAAHQGLSNPASGDTIRLTHGVRNNQNAGGSVWQRQDKLSGVGDPLSLQISITSSDLSIDTFYEAGRFVMLERGALSLSATVIEEVRDDIGSPATLTVSVGTLKTDADGDLDTDGFNERFGWYEVDADVNGEATFTIPGASTSRYYPAVRLHSFSPGGSVSGLTEGVDYLLDDLGDGNALLQILSVVSTDMQFAYEGSNFTSTPTAFYSSDTVTRPWAGNATWPGAIYIDSTDTTYVAWVSIADGHSTVRITGYDHSTNEWLPVHNIATFVLSGDDHGAVALCRDSEGYLYAFYGSHDSNQQWAISDSPDDHSSWTEQSAISGTYTYPKPVVVGSTLYLFLQSPGVGDEFVLCTASPSGGAATFGAASTIIDFGGGRFYGTEVLVSGTDLHFTATRADASDTERKGVYYFVYETATGDVHNFDDSVTVLAANLPVSLTDSNNDFRAIDHGANRGGVTSLAFDTNGDPHVLYLDGSGSSFDLKHITWPGTGGWSSPETVASGITDHDSGSGFVDGVSCVPGSAGQIEAWYPIDAELPSYERGGDMTRRVRSAGGTWGSPATMVEATTHHLAAPSQVKDGHADMRVIFTEVTPDIVDANAEALGRYIHGDSGFAIRDALDPDFADTVLLVQFQGADTDTDFRDDSSSFHTLNAAGDAQIQSNKLELDGTGDYVWSADNGDWHFDGDFTIEIFGAEIDSLAATAALISHYQAFGDDRSWLFIFAEFLDPDRMRLALSLDGDNNNTFDDDFIPATDGTEYDWCIERSGSTVRIYRDGVMQASGTLSGSLNNCGDVLRIGASGGGGAGATDSFWDGRLSAVRITKGTARYADDGGYAVPALPLPSD